MEEILSFVLSIIVTVIVFALGICVMKACNSCTHSYERVDFDNDKKMVLVCRKCGKIKKLRK